MDFLKMYVGRTTYQQQVGVSGQGVGGERWAVWGGSGEHEDGVD